jgi:phage head maturation protease|nr:MAG TPA: prohead protease [Caudoviricetes sp.]
MNLYERQMAVQTASGNVEQYMDRINQMSHVQLSAEDVFVYQGIISSDAMDSYYTKMDAETSLRNYANDLKAGTPLMTYHETSQSPIGRSFDSSIDVKEDGKTVVRGLFYIVRHTKINGESTDDLIRQIETGTLTEMSVGFGGINLWYKSSYDGKDIFESRYYPGDKDENGNLVYYYIMDATLREVSLVYKGACPDAVVERIRNDLPNMEDAERQIQKYETRFNVRIDMPKQRSKEGKRMNIEEIKRAVEKGDLQRGELLKALKVDAITDGQRSILKELGEDASIETVRSLKEKAEIGKRAFEEKLDELVKARVAIGQEFDQEKYKEQMRSMDVDFIEDQTRLFEDIKKAEFKPGRQTQKQNDEEGKAVFVSESYKGEK